MLAVGKRRPCCYSIVPFSLYKALAADHTAKAAWSKLTPAARRDFISSIDSATEPDIRQRRVEKVCAVLRRRANT